MMKEKKSRKGLIYCVTNLKNDKVYIGQTTQKLEQRMKDHINKSFNQKSSTYFHNALRKNGLDMFQWDILREADTIQELNILEKEYIEKYKSNDTKFGYNLTSGGENYTVSESTKKKISEARKGKVLSLEHRKNISKGLKQSNHPLHGVKGISHPLFGVSRSNITRQKISNSLDKKDNIFKMTGAKYSNRIPKPWKRVWESYIHYNNKYKSLGYFEDMLSARIVYEIVKNEIWRG